MSARARTAGLAVALLLGLAAVGVAPRPAHAQTLKHNCSFCHDLHGGSASALTQQEVVEDLCWSCHDNAVLGDTQVLRDGVSVTVPQNGYAVHNGAKHTAFSRAPTGCWDCHNHEGESDGLQGRNLVMIQATMPTPVSGSRDVIFKSRGSDAGSPSLYSFADGDEDNDGAYTGVCEACHTETSNHQNGLNLPDASNHAHERGRTCSDCHAHSAGFPVPPCATCHDAGGEGTTGPNSRRAIIPEMSRTSHHVGSAYEDDDCKVCHDMSDHEGGAVRLKNVDTGGVLVLGADPATDEGTARDLTYFCLACHDDAGAGPAQPFSDGLAPPAVDSTLWEASSHANDSDVRTCYGGTGGFGCHSTAHGSQKRNLLAPAETAPNATTLYEEEEGFCFQCHAASGVASSDIQSQFAGAIRWVTAAAGENSNLNLNDRHDVQHEASSRSGAKIECYNCHDPHAANNANKLRADPDPTDGRVPGTGQVLVTGDFMTEWCLDCHDGSFPPGVSDQTTSIIDIRTAYDTLYTSGTRDAHGEAGGNPNNKSGYGLGPGTLVPCLACHAPHNGARSNRNLFQMKDVVTSLIDGVTPIPPDGTDTTYALIDNNVVSKGKNPTTFFDYKQGYMYCNTCHAGSMGSGKDNCQGCHNHGSNNF